MMPRFLNRSRNEAARLGFPRAVVLFVLAAWFTAMAVGVLAWVLR
jgi:hypothetical protein